MKTVSKKLFSLLLVAVLLVSVLPFQALANTYTVHIEFWDYNWDGTYVKKSENNITAPTMINGVVPTVTAPAGWRFAGWAEVQPNMTFEQVNALPSIDLMKYFCRGDTLYAAKYVKDTYTLSFNTGKADVANPKSMTVTNGKLFSDAGSYPGISSINGYTFGGWKYEDTVLTSANWSSVKFTSGKDMTLEAYWIPDTVRASFYKWDSASNSYVTHKHVEVKYGEYVKLADVPALSGVNTKPYYEAIGWQSSAGDDAVAVDPTAVQITGQTNFYARYLGDVVTITLDPKSSKLDPISKEVRIGDKLGNYGGKLPSPSLTGYTFIGWYTTEGTKVDDETIFWNSYSKLEAKWAEQAQVRLLVYKDGNTTNPIVSRLIPGGIVNGKLDVDTIAIGSYLPSGATYKLTGYFDKDGWTDYVLNGIVRTVDNINCGNVGVTEVYAMVETVSTSTGTVTGTGSGSNNTGSGTGTVTKPADPTNPATGDNSMIVASMTVMTLSAAALVVFMQLRKRKMI